MKILPINSDKENNEKKRLEWWVWLFFGFMAILLIDTVSKLFWPHPPSTIHSTDNVAGLPDELWNNMTPEERAQYNREPQSAGYANGERQTLRDLGVSAQEARAAETVLRQNGIDE